MEVLDLKTATGRYVITTRSGTKHYLDMSTRTVIRNATPGHEWDSGGVGFGEVTPDGRAFHFDTIRGYDLASSTYADILTVGLHMRCDSFHEWRISTEIKGIEEIT